MRRHDFRNALICAAVVTGAFLILNPFVNFPFNDDWSYSFTVRQLLATGRITYNGWSAPLIITQALWGAMFAKFFGYSFVTLRFSTLPFDIGIAVFSYLLARTANLRPASAMCISLTLCLSPLFLPLALSFMTDAPALCYILVSLYALIRAGQAVASQPALIWLAIGVLAGIIGGMGRQTVWIVPLCIIPYLIIIRRSNLRFVACAIAAWFIVILDVILTLQWYARQPDVCIDLTLLQCLHGGLLRPRLWTKNVAAIVLSTFAFVLPVAIPFTVDALRNLWRQRESKRSAITAIVILAFSIGIAFAPNLGMVPFYGIVTAKGVVGPLELSGTRPTLIPLFARGIVSALVLTTVFLLISRLVEFAVEFRSLLPRLRLFFSIPTTRNFLTIFSIVYLAVMVIRAGGDLLFFDRYALPLIPCLGILLLRGRSLAFAWPFVVIYAVYAVASTRDNIALAAARLAAIDRLESHGVPRMQIAGGLEYDFYTQLEESGVTNRYGTLNPSRPYIDSEGYTPALRCKYRLEFPHSSDTEPSQFGAIHYISWLPPFHRTIYIDQFRNPWWLSPNTRGSTAIPWDFERDFDD